MTPPVPFFIRRAWRMLEARRALFEGQPERALTHLRDPALALSPRADTLRERALDVLYRSAVDRHAQGRDASVARLIGVAAGEDPQRASLWEQHLQPQALGTPRRPALKALLAQMRDREPESDARPSAARRAQAAPSARTTTPERAHLAVDDGGEFLVVSGQSVTIGHAQAGRADVPLLADLDSVHARLFWSESFHSGTEWRIEALGQGVKVHTVDVAVGQSAKLADGDEVELSPNVRFHFRLPETASTSSLLELQRGLESEGAVRVLVLARGAAGRIKIGPHEARHIPVAGLEHEVTLALRDAALEIHCAGGVRVLGVDGGAQESCRLPFPPPLRVDVTINARPSQRPPFALTLRPLETSGGAE